MHEPIGYTCMITSPYLKLIVICGANLMTTFSYLNVTNIRSAMKKSNIYATNVKRSISSTRSVMRGLFTTAIRDWTLVGMALSMFALRLFLITMASSCDLRIGELDTVRTMYTVSFGSKYAHAFCHASPLTCMVESQLQHVGAVLGGLLPGRFPSCAT